MNNKIIFRNDDISANSNFKHIQEIYQMILDRFPNAEIYSCITILAKSNEKGMVALSENITKDKRNFYGADKIFDFTIMPRLYNIISHSLFHCNHRLLSYELQKMLILTSCNLLNTNIFIPPLWAWNENTEKICKDNNINLWVAPDWKNIDRIPFNPNHQYWLFHSWKYTPESFEKAITQ